LMARENNMNMPKYQHQRFVPESPYTEKI